MLRLSAHLGAGSEAGATAAVAALAGCCAAQPDALRIACVQAMDAGATAAAQQALQCLLDQCSASSTVPQGTANGGAGLATSSCLQAPGFEATVFQNLIHLLLADDTDSAARGSQAAGAASDGTTSSRHCQLARMFDQAVERMRAVGPEAFFALHEGRPLQQEWFTAQVTGFASIGSASAAQMQTVRGVRVCNPRTWRPWAFLLRRPGMLGRQPVQAARCSSLQCCWRCAGRSVLLCRRPPL